jgi:hypothetical protein
MRAEREWEVQGNEGIQLWTVPVVLLALMMIAGGVRSVLTPERGGGDAARSFSSPVLGSSEGFGPSEGYESGGARPGQRDAAGEPPVGRLGD